MRVSIPAILFFIATFLLAGFFLPFRVRVRARRDQGQFSLEASVRPPLMPIYVALPRLQGAGFRLLARGDADSGAGGKSPAHPEGGNGGDEGDQEKTALLRTIDVLRDSLSGARGALRHTRDVVALVFRVFTFEKVEGVSRAGTGDAYETAMLCGALNALVGIGLSMARRAGARFREKPKLKICPEFDEPCFAFCAQVEVSFTLWRASYLAGKILRLLWTRSRGDLALSSQKSVEY